MLDTIIQASNCERSEQEVSLVAGLTFSVLSPVDRDEVDRLRKRFMKLDKVAGHLKTPGVDRYL